MKKMINSTHIEGFVYEHKLELKVSGDTSKNPGTEFIAGTLSIATDDDCLNVVPVHFTYVTETTKTGKTNNTFIILKNIIDGKIPSVMSAGKENAGMIRIDSAIDLNEWYDQNGQLISVKRNEGGFVHQINELCDPSQRATFNTDILINGTTYVEADEEKNTPEKLVVKGSVFSFRNALLPVEFTVFAPGAIKYFESLDASPSNPVFTRVQGQQLSQTVIKKTTEESAFGEAIVKESKSSYRDFVINWAQADVYDWDSEGTILASELTELIANREVYKAEIKKRQDEYQASKGNAIKTAAATTKSVYSF